MLGEELSYANYTANRYRLGHTLVWFWILPWLTATVLEGRPATLVRAVGVDPKAFSRSQLGDRPG